MSFKSQTIPPLETIYEESNSFVSSNVDLRYQSSYSSSPQTINGLISSRSIPTVDIERQRAQETKKKLPIEVRFRDGSKRFIPPTNLQIQERRQSYQARLPEINTENVFSKKIPLAFTLITVDDLNRAGVTPSLSSTPDASERNTVIQSFSNSSLETKMIDSTKQSTESVHSVPSYSQATTSSEPLVKIVSTKNVLPNSGSRSAFRPFLKAQTVHVPSHWNSNTIRRSHPIQESFSIQKGTHQSNPFRTYPRSSNPIHIIDSNTQWYSVISNSVYDVPRLSIQYPNVPLHITIPVNIPIHQPKTLIRHDVALEQRLLSAGLSPETVALYERILQVANQRCCRPEHISSFHPFRS